MKTLLCSILLLSGCAVYTYDLGENARRELDDDGRKGACLYKCSNLVHTSTTSTCISKVKYERYCVCTCPL